MPLHVESAFAGGTQDVHDVVPHEVTLVLLTQSAPQACEPALQLWPQVAPLQVAVPFDGGVHGVHAPPQVATSRLLTQAPPQRWRPDAQATPHWKFEHVGDPLATPGQLLPQPPQLSALLETSTHDAPHVVSPLAHECWQVPALCSA